MGYQKMNNSNRIVFQLIAISIFVFSTSIRAQNVTDMQDKRPDQIFSENIKTVQINREGVELGDPVLVLNEDIPLVCTFDDLSADYLDYKFTLIHCDPEWNTTEGLTKEDYLESYYFEDYVRDYEPSYNTTTPFVHYSFKFPNENIRPVLSGNYLLVVYEDTPEEPAFTRGIFVTEQLTGIEGRVAKSANPTIRPEVQQLFFTVSMDRIYLDDPYRNLKVIVSQHGRWDNEITDITPTMITNSKLHFEQEGMVVFKGNNEFRFLDLKSLRYLAPKVSEISVADGRYEAFITDRKPARFLAYQYREDINGKYLIHTEDGRDAGTEADYVNVKLFLPYDRPIAGGKLYVTGDFCNWKYLEENRAIYSPGKGGYFANLFLKQGYYNYTWAVVELGNLPADAAFIDGTFSDVQNLYTIRVYYRNPGDYHYRLIGRQVLNSSEYF